MTDFPIKVAVGTKTQLNIDAHFGHAKQFLIFSLSPEDCTFIETREVENYCHGHPGSDTAMQKILHTIKDCYAVFSAMIGDGPKEKLANIGVLSVTEYGHEAIEASILDYAKKLDISPTS